METEENTALQQSCIEKPKKVNSKSRRNDDRAVEEILKSLDGIPGSLRLKTLAMKCKDLAEIHKKCAGSISSLEKKCTILEKERDHFKSDNRKQLLARTHLEGLCRELHRLNKMVKDDSVERLREEEERREELTSKFETTLNQVSNIIYESNMKNDQVHDENISLINKMKLLYNEFESRKVEQVRLDQQLDLERQLAHAQIEKSKFEMQAERALWDEERTLLSEKLKKSEDSCLDLQLVVEQLHKQMGVYEDRYLGYKSTIDHNSQFFENCKTKIQAMNSKVALLEKEIVIWKERSQQNALKVADISTLKQAQDEQFATALKQVNSLQSLCRQLQNDRSLYLKILHSKGINPDCPTYLEKEEMRLPQKFLLLKPIWNQLQLVRTACITPKDQMSLNALQCFIEDSKTLDAVNSAINLSLGFINFIGVNKKAFHHSANCIMPS